MRKNDISKKIFSNLTDKDFCHFVTVSDKYYKYYSRFKTISNSYDLSKIIPVREKYKFVNIYHDLYFWNINNMPLDVQIITLHDFFNDELVDVDKLKSLTHIYPGMQFTKYNSVNLLKHLQNYKEIAMNVISNMISINVYCEEPFTKTKSVYLGSNRFTILTWIRIINSYIQNKDIHNYEPRLNNFINQLRLSEDESFYDTMNKFDLFRSYQTHHILELSNFVLNVLEYNDKFITKLLRKYCNS